MIEPRTSKAVAKRIDIRYATRLDSFRRRRWLLALAALLLPSVWLAYAAVRQDAQIFQAGPVSEVHASIAQDCSKCHTEPWQPLGRLLTFDSQIKSVPDIACRSCHNESEHQTTQIRGDVPACAACHREHRGAERMALTPDVFCTSCHENLSTIESVSRRVAQHITDFDRSHPDFRPLTDSEPDRSAIRFNHAVHLRTDGFFGPGGESVSLQCRSCHQFDREGRYALPIVYEDHCASCHPLLFDTANFRATSVPHEAPETIRDFLRGRYLEIARTRTPSYRVDPHNDTRRRRPIESSPATPADPDLLVQERIDRAEYLFYELDSGCRLCHQMDQRNGELPKIVPPNVPSRWLSQSRFSHLSHERVWGRDTGRPLECVACHEAKASRATSDELVPKISICRDCHSSTGGARRDCVACHLYHAESPLRKRGDPIPLNRAGTFH